MSEAITISVKKTDTKPALISAVIVKLITTSQVLDCLIDERYLNVSGSKNVRLKEVGFTSCRDWALIINHIQVTNLK